MACGGGEHTGRVRAACFTARAGGDGTDRDIGSAMVSGPSRTPDPAGGRNPAQRMVVFQNTEKIRANQYRDRP